MNNLWSRRRIVSGLAATPLAASAPKVWAQAAGADQGTLARLRAAKSVTVGVPNFLPFSGIETDGSLGGLAPALTKVIMGRLGVPEVKGILVPGYAELIPGMQAGRWDFICAALVISKARCAQVAFADPIVMEGGLFVALKGALPNMPKSVAEAVAQKLAFGVGVAEVYGRFALAAGASRDNVKEFQGDVGMLDALEAKRVQIIFQGRAALTQAYKARNLAVDVTYPVADFPVAGSTCAFRMNDGDLLAAFQQELRAMKASGEFLTISRENGFDPVPSLIPTTVEQACAAAA